MTHPQRSPFRPSVRRFVRLSPLAALAVLAALVALVSAASGSARAAGGPPETSEPNKSPFVASFYSHAVDFTEPMPREKTLPVKIYVDRLSTSAELAKLAKLSGDALLEALTETQTGRMSIGDYYVAPLAYALRYRDGSHYHMLLLAQRPLAFGDLFKGAPSPKHPFTIIQLDVNTFGAGSGAIVTAGDVRIRPDGRIEIQGLDFLQTRLIDVEPLKS